jgi:hypothetical protein
LRAAVWAIDQLVLESQLDSSRPITASLASRLFRAYRSLRSCDSLPKNCDLRPRQRAALRRAALLESVTGPPP